MNNDGFGQVGAGIDDNRLAGEDLQHSRQYAGGPVKEYQEKKIHEHLATEKNQHKKAMEHAERDLERHRSRPYNSQHISGR
jgi:hypothetical protein